MTSRILLLALTSASVWAESKLGKPLKLSQPSAIHEILATPADFAGKTVQVKGKITEVCQAMGCWMALVDPTDSSKTIRINVEDGEIVFPKDSAGKTAIAEGVLTKQELTREQVIAKAKHEAEEQGRKFDAKQVKQGASYYEIRGTGAVISGS